MKPRLFLIEHNNGFFRYTETTNASNLSVYIAGKLNHASSLPRQMSKDEVLPYLIAWIQKLI